MTKIAQSSFLERLLKASHSVPGLDKLGKGETDQDYDWVKASQIFTAFRKELRKAAILILPNELEVTRERVNSATGTWMNQVTIKKEFIVRDCRSDEELRLIAFGIAQDLADKALYKAKTGCIKYFLRDMGVIPWLDVNDPEYDQVVNDVTTPAEKKKRGATSAKQLSQRNVTAFARACQEGGKTLMQQVAYITECFKVQSVEELSVEQFNIAMRWAFKNGDDLAEVMEISRKSAERKNGKAERVLVPDPEQTSQAGD